MSNVSVAFQNKFNAWADKALAKPVPEAVIAFSFNLAEPWCVELVGSDKYTENDPDWACPPEAFRAKIKTLNLPEAEVGSDWQTVLATTKAVVTEYLSRANPGSDRLRQAVAVVVGFVDGDLHKVWPL